MKVALLRPPMVLSRMAHTAPTCPPIGLAYVAASARAAGHDVSIVDAVGEAMFRYRPLDNAFLVQGLDEDAILERVPESPDVIGVSLPFAQQIPCARLLVRRLRRLCPQARIVAGGEHVSALPEASMETMPELDAVVVGEGEETFPELLAAYRDGDDPAEVKGVVARFGGLRRGPPRNRITAIDDLPLPAWDLVPLSTYLDHGKGFGVNRGRNMPVIASRGCPYRCTFCTSPSMWTPRWVRRDPVRLLDEMEGYLERYSAENFDFYDLTGIINRDWIVEFCRLIISRCHTFTWQLPCGTRSEAIDMEVADLLYRAGCRNLTFAPESGSKRVLTRIKKKVDLRKINRAIRASLATKLNVKANLLLGFPGETRIDVSKSLLLAARMALVGLHDISICSFSPIPGTELFEELRREGRIPDVDDAFFRKLVGYSDLTDTVSWSEHLGGRELAFYRTLGILAFYFISFITRPWRPVRIMVNLLRGRQESRGEKTLHDIVSRHFLAASRKREDRGGVHEGRGAEKPGIARE